MLTGNGVGTGRIDGQGATGGRDRWPEVVERFGPYVHAVAVDGYGLAPDDARDVFQEVFLRTWERLAGPDGDAGLQGFVAGTARTAAAARGQSTSYEAVLRRLDDALVVGEAIRKLPTGQRDVARRFFLEREQLGDIATSVGRDIGAVADEVRRARRRVRRELDETRRHRAER